MTGAARRLGFVSSSLSWPTDGDNLYQLNLQEGWGEFQVCQDRGERADAFRQYLKPVLGRANLTVLRDAKTLRIEMEQGRGNAVARGVTYQTRGPDGPQHSGILLPLHV